MRRLTPSIAVILSHQPTTALYKLGRGKNHDKSAKEYSCSDLHDFNTLHFQDYISTMVGQVALGSFWVGLKYSQKDEMWRWVDNTTVNTDVM